MAKARDSIAQFQLALVEILAGKGRDFTDEDIRTIIGTIDGKWGPRTKSAMNFLQKSFDPPMKATIDPTRELIEAMFLMTTYNKPPLYDQLISDVRAYKAERKLEEEKKPVVVEEEPPPEIEPVRKKVFPWWGWLLIGVGVVGITAGSIYYFGYYRKRKKGSQSLSGYGELSDGCSGCFSDLGEMPRFSWKK
jgi:hypothetical protein